MGGTVVRALALALGLAGIAVFLLGLDQILEVATCDERTSRGGEQVGPDCDEGTGAAIAELVGGALTVAAALLLEARTRRVWRLGPISALLLLAWPVGAAVVLLAGDEAIETAIGAGLVVLTALVALLAARAARRRRRLRERGQAALGRIESCDAETASDFSGAVTHKVVVALGDGERVKGRLTVPRGDADPQPGEEVVVFSLGRRRLVARDETAFARARGG